MNMTKKDIEKIVEFIENPPPPNQEIIIAARKHRLAVATKLAEESWEGCDGCDENDKNFYVSGYIHAMMGNNLDIEGRTEN